MNVETFTGNTWSGMSWELGGVLIALIVSVLLCNFVLYLFEPARIDEDQGRVSEQHLTRHLTGDMVDHESLIMSVQTPGLWTRRASHTGLSGGIPF
jgi:hypothetical protein